MSNMLDVAGGIIIASLALGIFGLGVHLSLSIDDRVQFTGIGVRVTGVLLAAVGGAFMFWLILVRTGSIHLVSAY